MKREQKAVVVMAIVLFSIPTVAVASTLFVSTTGDIALNSNSGPTVVVGGGPEIDFGSAFVSDTKVNVTTKAGNMTVYSSSDTSVEVDKSNLEGTTTSVTNVDASSATLRMNPADKPAISVFEKLQSFGITTKQGNVNNLEWRNPTVDDGTVDFSYDGPTGNASITIRGVPANTQLGAADQAQSKLQGVSTSNGNGNVTFSNLAIESKNHDILIQTTSGGPSLSNGRPGKVKQPPSELKVQVNDSDMPYDTVDVAFDVDGNSVGSTTVGDNGTASVDVSGQSFVGGNHTVTATATDGYGATDTLTYEFEVPSNLSIRKETKPSELVDNATVEVTFYFESGGVDVSDNRTATNGTLNMTGLPIDQPLIASAEADGFRNRRIFIGSVYEQQRIYLLNESKKFTRTTFDLKDYTGNFPQDTTVLKVQRTFNGTYKTVLGDYFGATGEFPGELQFNKRHRLILLNTETGETRELGTYTPLASGAQDLAVSVSGTVEPISSDAQLSTAPSTGLLPAGNVTLSVNLRDAGENITAYNVTFKKRVNGQNTTLKTVNRTSSGLIRRTINLSGAEGGKAIVESEYKTSEGISKRRTTTFGIVNRNSPPPILGELTALVNLLPQGDRDAFTTAVALLITLLGTAGVASRARLAPETIGALAVGWLTIFGVLGWIGFDLLFVGVVVFGSLTILRRGV